MAAHQRPGVGGVPGPEPSDERARDDLQIDEGAKHDGRRACGRAGRWRRLPLLPVLADGQREPEGIARDYGGKRQMRGQPVLAHIDPVAAHEAACHHEPAEPALRAAKHEQRRHLGDEGPGDRAAQQEIGEG